MTLADLQHIIQQGESERIEFKDATKGLPSAFYETAVSFSNTAGGIVLLGVNDNGRIIGLTEEGKKFLLNR